MLLLAFDTATPAITVAVHDGHDVVAEASGEGPPSTPLRSVQGGAPTARHGELLAPAIRAALADAGVTMSDLTDIAVGVGPGPFTGLRVGVVTALTLGSTLDIATHGVCTLDILAADVVQQGPPQDEFLVATDARRKEVYWAHYRPGDGAAERLDGPHVSYPADLAELHPGMPVVGRGAALYPDVLTGRDGPSDPSASALARAVAAGTVEELPLEPLYLRRPDATPMAGVPGLGVPPAGLPVGDGRQTSTVVPKRA